MKCRSHPKSYAGAGCNRGHLLPTEIFGGREERKETFLMNNVAPQKSSVNRGAGAKIERFVRVLTVRHGKLEVKTGGLLRRGEELHPARG